MIVCRASFPTDEAYAASGFSLRESSFAKVGALNGEAFVASSDTVAISQT
jgi:hypothetical protein